MPWPTQNIPISPENRSRHRSERGIVQPARRKPERAGFLAQLEASPFSDEASRRPEQSGDPLLEQATRSDLIDVLIELPMEAMSAMTLGVAVRLVAAGIDLSDHQIESVAESCWRAVTVDRPTGRFDHSIGTV